MERVRGALLRRPRSLGNWVQAFAYHDTTGLGVLGTAEFVAFLASLSLGLSRVEVREVTQCLADGRGVSLGSFSQAITYPPTSQLLASEAWAVQAASAMAGSAPRGLMRLSGRSASEVLAQQAEALPAADVERLLAWLPKGPDGAVDWAAAEEWRVAVLGDLSRR